MNVTEDPSAYNISIPGFTNLAEEEFENLLSEKYENIDIVAVGIPVWLFVSFAAVGVVLNTVNVIVFTRPTMKSPLNILLASLEASNFVIFTLYLPYFVAIYCPSFLTTYTYASMKRVSRCLAVSATCFSTWLTFVIGLWRLIAVTKPLASAKLCSKKNTVRVVIGILVVSLFLFVLWFFFNRVMVSKVAVRGINSTTLKTVYSLSVDHKQIDVSTTWLLASAIKLLITAVPCLLSSVTTLLLLANLWIVGKKRRKLFGAQDGSSNGINQSDTSLSRRANVTSHEGRITVTLLLIMILSLLAFTPISVSYLSRVLNPQCDVSKRFMGRLAYSRFGFLIANCWTFFIYFGMSEIFRRTFFDMFKARS